MKWVSWLLFESATALAAIVALALFFLLVHWRRTLNVRPLLIGLGVAAALFVMQALVVTPRETAEAVLDPIIADLSRGKTTALAAALAPEFRADDRGAAAFLELVKRKLEIVQIQAARSGEFLIESQTSDRFEAQASYIASITHRSEGMGYVPSAWRFVFVRRSGVWRIAEIRPVHILNVRMRDWDQVDQMR